MARGPAGVRIPSGTWCAAARPDRPGRVAAAPGWRCAARAVPRSPSPAAACLGLAAVLAACAGLPACAVAARHRPAPVAAHHGVATAAAIAAAAIATAAGLKNLAEVNSIKIDKNPGFEQGGYTGKGHPKSVSKALGEKPYTYHADEYVVPSPVLNSPEGAVLVNHLEGLRLHLHNLGPGPRFVLGRLHAETGGLIPAMGNPLEGRAIVNVSGISAEEVRTIVTDTIRSMPQPVVSVQEINTVQQGVIVREGLSNW